MRYPVVEQFLSFQGEGVHVGRPASFIRLAGCDVGCAWCDQKETWHPRERAPVTILSARELSDRVPAAAAFAVVTGGEPGTYDLGPLTEALWDRSVRVHVETAGHHPLAWGIHWLTVSPKLRRPPLLENVRKADEFKIVIQSADELPSLLALIADREPETPVWLIPEWSKRNDLHLLQAITKAVAAGYGRAGYQVHKLYKVR